MSRILLLLTLFASLSLPSLSQSTKVNAGASPKDAGAIKIVGYFTQWGIYSGHFAKSLVTSGSAPLLTHINYAFGNIVKQPVSEFLILGRLSGAVLGGRRGEWAGGQSGCARGKLSPASGIEAALSATQNCHVDRRGES